MSSAAYAGLTVDSDVSSSSGDGPMEYARGAGLVQRGAGRRERRSGSFDSPFSAHSDDRRPSRLRTKRAAFVHFADEDDPEPADGGSSPGSDDRVRLLLQSGDRVRLAGGEEETAFGAGARLGDASSSESSDHDLALDAMMANVSRLRDAARRRAGLEIRAGGPRRPSALPNAIQSPTAAAAAGSAASLHMGGGQSDSDDVDDALQVILPGDRGQAPRMGRTGETGGDEAATLAAGGARGGGGGGGGGNAVDTVYVVQPDLRTAEICAELLDKMKEINGALQGERRKGKRLGKEKLVLRLQLASLEEKVKMLETREKQREREVQRESKKRRNRLKLLQDKTGDDLGDETDGAAILATHEMSLVDRMRKSVQAALDWLVINMPLSGDVRFIRTRYGEGIATYFSFLRFLVLLVAFIFLLAIYPLTVEHLVREFTDGNRDSCRPVSFLPCFLQYSSYPDDGAFTYAVFVVLTFFVASIGSLSRLVLENRNKKISDMQAEAARLNPSMRREYGPMAFTPWNHFEWRVSDVDNQRHNLASVIRVMLLEEERKQLIMARSAQERNRLHTRRVLANIAICVVIVTTWSIVVMLTVIEQSLPSILITPAVISALGAMVPPVISFLTNFEMWDDGAFKLKVLIVRLYLLKILNLAIIVFGFLQLVARENLILSRESSVDENGVEYCVEDQVGIGLLGFIVADFVVHKVATMGGVLVRLLWFKRTGKNRKPEFQVANHVVGLMYSQGLIWVCLPYVPLLALLLPLMFLVNFKWERFILSTLTQKPIRPFSAKDTGRFLVLFHFLTFAIGLGALSYFLFGLEHHCEPQLGETTIDLVPLWFANNAGNVVVDAIAFAYVYTREPFVLWPILIILGTFIFFQRNSIALHSDVLRTERQALKGEIDRVSGKYRKVKAERDGLSSKFQSYIQQLAED